MHINNINLKNFRNYDNLSVELKKGANIFYGSNAQGKTNIIESIYMLSTGKSHRTQKDIELIKWNEDDSKIRVDFERESEKKTIELYIKKNNKKQIKINGVRLNKIGELLGNLITVIFSPDHMKIIKEGPSERRRFIDIILSQVKPSYYYNLTQYLKVLEQRNNLITEGWDDPELLKTVDIWDDQLVSYGAKVINDRINFIKMISAYAYDSHKKITDSKEELRLIYKNSFKSDKNDIEAIKTKYYEELDKSRSTDYRRGITQIGPHRDDILFYINGKEVRIYGSQGQQRTTLLSLKIAELELLNNEAQSYPVLLLDDVFSELDTQRQGFLMSFIENVQTIITCTDVEYFKNLNIKDFSLFNVSNGNVVQKK
ncbi:MAG: DNA replication/repair protein RecF [Bacillota bacterium]